MTETDRPIRKLAEILSRRGQTIYGKQAIIEICSKSGVSLLNTFDIGDPDSDEALQNFLVQYSKLSPAAKLTVLILSKQYDVPVPKDLLKKKKGFRNFLDSLQEYLPWSP